ncbi:MAG TPA: hypothetical protein VGS41_15830 [Chthonomonadales bacterium]|nr:hypothetical protein [Chthonomonadales bacterium]
MMDRRGSSRKPLGIALVDHSGLQSDRSGRSPVHRALRVSATILGVIACGLTIAYLLCRR